MRLFGKTNIDFMGQRFKFYMISAAILLVGIGSLAIKGVDYGIDFLGGTELIVQFAQPVQIGEIRTAMDRIGFGRAEIKTFGSNRDILIRSAEQGEGNTVSDRIQGALKQEFAANPYTVLKEDKIGPKIGRELRMNALYAVIATTIAIGLYVAVRFKFICAARS